MSKRLNKNKIEQKKRETLKTVLIPLAKSFVLWIVLVIVVAWDYTNHCWFSMLFIDFTTILTHNLSKLFFIPSQITGSGSSIITTLEVKYRTLSINGIPMLIELECTAYHAYLAIISLLIFSKWKLNQKLFTGTILLALLSFVNSLRIVLLGLAGHKFPNLFNLIHDYVWNLLMVIFLWAIWEYANRKNSPEVNEKTTA